MASRFQKVARARTASPPDMFTTADSFNLHDDDILHSTAQLGGEHSAQLPLRYAPYADSENGSEGSTGMSIELGRGVKRGGSQRSGKDELSSNFQFNMGNESQYEVIGTPPISHRGVVRKSDGGLRREAAIRSASTQVKNGRATSNPQHRSLSDTLRHISTEDPTASIQPRNTRFISHFRQTLANEPTFPPRAIHRQSQTGTPRRTAVSNPTAQSATYTANSFALPDLPNITELVSGTRKDGTPVFSRTTSKPSSRPASAGNKSLRPEHVPIEAIPTPDEEKQIYASLQLLQDRIADLEMDKSEAQQKQHDYENQIIELRSQLYAEQRRPDSALGSDEEQGKHERSRKETTRLQASIKSLQDRLDRSERKVSVTEISVHRVTKERNDVVTQLGVAYFNNEELKTENEELKENVGRLQAEQSKLQVAIKLLKRENEHLRMHAGDSRIRPTKDAEHQSDFQREAAPIRSKKESRAARPQDKAIKRWSTGNDTQLMQDDLALQIAREVQMHRDQATAAGKGQSSTSNPTQTRSRSKPRQREQVAGSERQDPSLRRVASAPVEADVSELEPSIQFETTQQRHKLPTLKAAGHQEPGVGDGDERDFTLLSFLDPAEVTNLRRKLEQERRDRKATSAPSQQQHQDPPRSSTEWTQTMPRKSSLKDITAGLDVGSGRFSLQNENIGETEKPVKSVRVQSPHTSDGSILPLCEQETEDVSIVSNTSRRRRAASAENVRSALIMADMMTTADQPFPKPSGKSDIQHNAADCTACHPSDKDIKIPAPIPVTDRVIPDDPDITSATVRPSQPPSIALAAVIKQLEDEIKHLKITLVGQQALYSQHTPAISKRTRMRVKSYMDRLTVEVDKRSDQVYDLYDVLEGQKQASWEAVKRGEAPREMKEREMEETLLSIGLDPAELAGRVGRQHDGNRINEQWSDDESRGLPWEGLSDYESDDEPREKRSSVY